MERLLIAFMLAWTALVTAVRRLVRGPRLAGWSWRLETMVGFIRWLLGRHAEGDIRQFRAGAEPPPLPLSPVLRRVRSAPVDVAGMQGEWVWPRRGEPSRTLLYLHGGAYITCSIETHRELVSRLAVACEARVLAVNYRLAPEHRFPAPVEDALKAYRWLLAQGTDPSRLVIAGDSAGGGLSLATMLSLKEAGDPLPAAAVLLSPWVDLADNDAGSMTENAAIDYIGGHALAHKRLVAMYLGGESALNPLASPLFGDHRGLPPLYLLAGGAEILRDQIVRLSERARKAGVDTHLELLEDMVHVWPAFALICRQGRESVGRIGGWVREKVPELQADAAAGAA